MNYREIQKIREQYASDLWAKFVQSIRISGLRGWDGQVIQLRFPVVAIVGENGTGKTTILKALASCYEGVPKKETYFPSNFFQDTQWDDVSNVIIEPTIKQGSEIRSYRITKKTQRWTLGNRPKRKVVYQDISRTLPLDATVGYARIAKQSESEIDNQDISDDNLRALSHVLGRKYTIARFTKTNISSHHSVGVLERGFGEFSQYHQGAGEDATLDLFQIFEDVPNNSLLLIDEVEASLHPKSQRRLIDYLLKLARQKRIQIVVSTHSPYVLEQLPPEARILLMPSDTSPNVLYGASVDFAMSRIDDLAHTEMNIFVEDKNAAVFLREILKANPEQDDIVSRVNICPVGPANVVQMMGKLAVEHKLPYKKNLAVLDGDKVATAGCITLPGNDAPEIVVYQQLKAGNWFELTDRFGIGAGTLFADLDDVITNPEHHKWNSQVGDKIRQSQDSVWEVMVREWVRNCLLVEDAERIYMSVKDILARENGQPYPI